MELHRDPSSGMSELSDDTVRVMVVSFPDRRPVPTAPRPHHHSPRDAILGRTSPVPNSTLPPVPHSPQSAYDPFEKPLPSSDEQPFWSLRDVLPELMETQEVKVRSV